MPVNTEPFKNTLEMIGTIESYCGFVRTNIAHIEAGDTRPNDPKQDPWGVKSLIGVIVKAGQKAKLVYEKELTAFRKL
jgi:hypothetical protein